MSDGFALDADLARSGTGYVAVTATPCAFTRPRVGAGLCLGHARTRQDAAREPAVEQVARGAVGVARLVRERVRHHDAPSPTPGRSHRSPPDVGEAGCADAPVHPRRRVD